MKRKITCFAVVALLLFASSAYGVSSYTTISSSQTGADGPAVTMNAGSSMVEGANDPYSDNALWVELYKSVTGPDTRMGGTILSPGGSSTNFYTTNTVGQYYVHLDPDGPYETGCIGWGRASQ